MVFLLCTFAETARAQCTKDNECKGERICVDGKCQDPAAQIQMPQLAATA
ncbi:MAG: hypothetical protein IT381_12975 [Deltaproteobacteria bacterium]|nr:hypothetical protein [Deltaproteobacteria bacterium]